MEGDGACSVRIETVLQPLYERMERMASRGLQQDGVYVFTVSRLFLTLAVRFPVAAAFLALRKAKWDGWLAVCIPASTAID